MPTADQIREERERRKWSQGTVAERARQFYTGDEPEKLVQQTVLRIEKGGNSKYRNAVLRALDLPIDGAADQADAINFEAAPDAPAYRALAGRLRDVEELGISVAGDENSEADFSLNGTVLSMHPRPPGLVGRDVFSVRVKNSSMYPRFKDGELVYVERNREPAVGEEGIIELKGTSIDQAGAAFIKEITFKGAKVVKALQHNPREEKEYERNRIKRMYRVVPWNELSGV